MMAATMCRRLSCCGFSPDGADGSATGMCLLSAVFGSVPAPRVMAKLSRANWKGSSSASSTLFMASFPPSNFPPNRDPVESTWSMLLRRFSFPPAEEECIVVVAAAAEVVELWPFTSYWFMEPRRIENQRDSREKGSDEMDGEELVELGEALAAVARETEPGLMPAGGTGEVVAVAAVVDIAGAVKERERTRISISLGSISSKLSLSD